MRKRLSPCKLIFLTNKKERESEHRLPSFCLGKNKQGEKGEKGEKSTAAVAAVASWRQDRSERAIFVKAEQKRDDDG